jgi:hypothetical protein
MFKKSFLEVNECLLLLARTKIPSVAIRTHELLPYSRKTAAARSKFCCTPDTVQTRVIPLKVVQPFRDQLLAKKAQKIIMKAKTGA